MVSVDRGQVLLTTAVVLAMLVLGAALVLTAATTTDVRSPDDPTTDALEADRILGDIERGAGGLAGAINAEVPPDTETLETSLASAFDRYDDRLYESLGDRRGTIVGLGSVSIEQAGTYVADPDLDTPLETNEAAFGTDSTERAAFAGLRVALERDTLPGTPEDSLQVRVNGTEQTRAIAMYADGDEVVVAVDTVDHGAQPDFAGGSSTVCGDDDVVEIDLSRTGVGAGDCHVDPFGALEADEDGYGLVFDDPDTDVHGGYHYVVDLPTSAFTEDGFADEPASTAFATPIAWTVGFEVTQHARASEHHTEVVSEIYNTPVAVELLEVPW